MEAQLKVKEIDREVKRTAAKKEREAVFVSA